MAIESNGRPSKIEELLIKHDLRLGQHEEQMAELRKLMGILSHAVENTERLLVLEGDRLDRLERIEARQNELFAEISEQLRNRPFM